jgi:hypothetical protein
MGEARVRVARTGGRRRRAGGVAGRGAGIASAAASGRPNRPRLGALHAEARPVTAGDGVRS